jgi:uncharacterized protein (TIGR01777 family)
VTVVSRQGAAGDVIPWEGAAFEEAVAAADALVNLAGAPIADARWTPERLALIRSSRVDTTAALARAAAACPEGRRPKVFVSGSAVGIYGMREDDAVLAEDASAGDDELARIVGAWEAAAEPAARAGVRVAYARTGLVLAKEDGVLAKMLAPFRFFVGGPLGGGEQYMSWVHWRDEVRALLFAVDDARLSGPFNIAAPAPVTMNAFARALGEALGRPSLFRVPRLALQLGVGKGVARMVLTGQRAVPRKLESLGFRFDFANLPGALRDLLSS